MIREAEEEYKIYRQALLDGSFDDLDDEEKERLKRVAYVDQDDLLRRLEGVCEL